MANRTQSDIIQQDFSQILAANPEVWKAFAGKTILVTGANGFIAAYLIRFLLHLTQADRNFKIKVIGLARNKAEFEARFQSSPGVEHLELLHQDVCDPIQIEEPVDFIIHGASHATPSYYGIDPVGTLAPNVFGTQGLLSFAQKKKVKGFLFLSSGEVYGDVAPHQCPTTETDYGYVDPAQVRACYGESKRMGETLCVCWFKQFGVPAVIARPFHTYGPGMRLSDGRVYSDFVADVVQGRNIVMKSDGSALRAYCYLSDLVSGLFTVLLKGKPGEAYNVGNDQGEISVLGLAKLLVGLYPDKKLQVKQVEDVRGIHYLKSPIKRNCPNISKVKELGWAPLHPLEEGFRRTVDSFISP